MSGRGLKPAAPARTIAYARRDPSTIALQGAGNFASPRVLEVGGADLGQPAVVSLIDAIDNGNRNSLEALYLPGFDDDGLHMRGGSTLIINSINTYVFLDGQWVHLNPLFTGGITQIQLSSLTNDVAADGLIMLPEPTSLAWLGLGGMALLSRRSRR